MALRNNFKILPKCLGSSFQLVNYSTKSVPENPKTQSGNPTSVNVENEKGVVYRKIPARVKLEAGKWYSWCSCGRSGKQPFCDGTHKDVNLGIKQKPVRFQVEKSKHYFLCNCKQTNNRPFCDGTHVLVMIRGVTSTIRSYFLKK